MPERVLWRAFRACALPSGGLFALLLIAGTALAATVPPARVAAAAPATDARTVPLDFSYRIHGTGPAIGIVFDDGRDVFLQPADPAMVSSLRIFDLPFRVQGPYLVVRGLSERIEVGGAGAASARTIIEYRGQRPSDAPDSHAPCRGGVPDEQRVTVPFGTGALHTEPGGVEHLARMVAIARGARRVTIVSQGDRANSPIALRRAARLRELLVAAGVDPGSIVEQVQWPAASSVQVIALRDAAPCARPAIAAGAPAPSAAATAPAVLPEPLAPVQDVPMPSAAAPSVQDSVVAPSPDLRLVFQPNSSVQATLRHYLKAHAMDVEFRAMPVLMVEEYAEVGGSNLREVLRRALSRLGLRGEIQGNRLLVVEPAR